MEFKDYIHDEYKWPPISEEEVDRLAKVLSTHLRQMGLKLTSEKRKDFVKEVLKKQKGTCAFAEGDDRFCWNEPKDKHLSYLKLQWGHKIPRSHGKHEHQLDNLILLCARSIIYKNHEQLNN